MPVKCYAPKASLPLLYITETSENYRSARNQCSSRLLANFDQELRHYPDIDWQPSETFSGACFFYFSSVTYWVPLLCYMFLQVFQEHSRNRLHNELIYLTSNEERFNITRLENFNNALESGVFSFNDLIHCPVSSLEWILSAECYPYVLAHTKRIHAQKHDLSLALDSLQRQLSICKDPEVVARLNMQIKRTKNELSECSTVMEIITQSQYNFDIINQLKKIFTDQRNAECLRKYRTALRKFNALLIDIDSRISMMNTQNLNEQDKIVLNSATQLYRSLQEAKDTLETELSTLNQQNVNNAYQHFISTCQNAVQEASPILRKDHFWRDVLGNIANALVFIATLSLSYWVTGKYRLFTPLNQTEENAAEILHEAESTLNQLNQNL